MLFDSEWNVCRLRVNLRSSCLPYGPVSGGWVTLELGHTQAKAYHLLAHGAFEEEVLRLGCGLSGFSPSGNTGSPS